MKKHTEDCLDANDDTSVLKGKCICNEAPEECKTGHTPTPLDNVCIVQKYSDSNRVLELRKEFNDSEAFIVRSVNSHDALIDALKICLDQISYASRYKFGSDVKTLRDTMNNVTNILTDALKLDEDK